MQKLLLIVCSVLFLIGGVYLMAAILQRKLTCKTPASATVTDLKHTSTRGSRHRRRTTYTPVCEFRAGSMTVSTESFLSSKPGKYRVGDRVEILYNEKKPTVILVEGQSAIPMLLSGLLLFALGIFGLYLILTGALA